MSESQHLDLTEQRIRRLAELLADAVRVGKEADEFGAPGFRRRGKGLMLSAVMLADCLPSSVALAVADEVRAWSGEIDRDDAHASGLRWLLRHLDPGGSPKVH